MENKKDTNSVRMDKWLWAARFFKTRTLAAKACELGRIESRRGTDAGWVVAKAAHDVHAGDVLKVKNESGEYLIDVLGVTEVRGPAVMAQNLYRETDESKAARIQLVEARRMLPLYERSWESGRPTKRDRRAMNKLRGR